MSKNRFPTLLFPIHSHLLACPTRELTFIPQYRSANGSVSLTPRHLHPVENHLPPTAPFRTSESPPHPHTARSTPGDTMPEVQGQARAGDSVSPCPIVKSGSGGRDMGPLVSGRRKKPPTSATLPPSSADSFLPSQTWILRSGSVPPRLVITVGRGRLHEDDGRRRLCQRLRFCCCLLLF